MAPEPDAAAASGGEPAVDAPPAPRPASLRHEGAVWTLVHGGRTVRVKDVRGLHYLGRLLAEPGREFHVLDLASPEGGGARSAELAAAGGDLGPALDARAKRELRERLEDLREREETAERDHDLESARRARAEIEHIADELARAMGLGGRDRKTGAVTERARASVTKAIRMAIRLIASGDAALGAFLSRAIRTGAYCSYEPIGETPIVWGVELPPSSVTDDSD